MDNNYKALEYKGEKLLIKEYLILGMNDCNNISYNIFDLNIEKKINNIILKTNKNNYNNYSIYRDINYEYYNNFKKYKELKDKKIYLASFVKSKKYAKTIICVYCPKYMKVWLNGKLIAVNSETVVQFHYITAELKKGMNVFLLEMYSPTRRTVFNIQIRDFEYETGNDMLALSNIKDYIVLNPDLYLSEKIGNEEYRFMHLFNKTKNIRKDMKVTPVNIDHGLIKEFYRRIDEPVSLNLKEIINKFEKPITSLRIDHTCYTTENKEITFCPLLFFDKITPKYKNAVDNILIALNEITNLKVKTYIEGVFIELKRAYNSGDMYTTSNLSSLMVNFIDKINNGLDYEKYFYSQGIHTYYIRSTLDNKLVKISYLIPNNYNYEKKYPAIFALATGNVGLFCSNIKVGLLNEPILAFDITGRGYTGGSYIGEASILEIISWIKTNFNIDKNRIYILGTSNGGYATWAITQNYPHIPAAIYPLIGYADVSRIKNVSNIPAYQIVSSDDHVFKGREKEIYNNLNPYKNYTQYNCKGMLHNHFNIYINHPRILNNMLAKCRNEYPEEVVFSTVRNRHLKSFWVKLHGIKKGCKSASVRAQIVDNKFIKINIKGTDGITIKLSPIINKMNFSVLLNKKQFNFSNYFKDEIMFVKKKKTWIISEKENKYNLHKGTGLLDVFLGKLSIILPRNPSETLKNIANKFSSPNTNGFDTKIYINYPIYYEDDLTNDVLQGNIILLNLNILNDNNIIKCNKNGFKYAGKEYIGKYVVMQINNNIYNNSNSILVINTNNENLLKSHILLRKIIIPTYSSGIHKLWNNHALIFYNGKYYRIYEQGGILEEIR